MSELFLNNIASLLSDFRPAEYQWFIRDKANWAGAHKKKSGGGDDGGGGGVKGWGRWGGGVKQLKSSRVSPAPHHVSGEFCRGLSIELDSINITRRPPIPPRPPPSPPHCYPEDVPFSARTTSFQKPLQVPHPSFFHHGVITIPLMALSPYLPSPPFITIAHTSSLLLLPTPTYPPPAPSKYLCPSQQLGMFI